MDSSITCLLLFSLFTFSSGARTPFHSTHIHHGDDIHRHPFPISQTNLVEEATAFFNPNDKLEPEPLTSVQWEPKIVPSETSIPKPEEITESVEMPTDTKEISNPLPFTIVSFHPMDPRIPRRPSSMLFHPHHHCHHNNKNHYYKPWKLHLALAHRDRNIMMSSNNVDKDLKDVTDPVAHSEVRPKWMRLGRIEPMFSDERNMASMERTELLRRLYHRYHHRAQEPVQIKDTGLIKRIRKFLNRYV